MKESFCSKVMTLKQAVKARAQLAHEGRKLVVTNGCFDMFHRGHAEYLMKARSYGDALYVLVNSDASVRALKGPARPVFSEEDRAFLLSCFRFVDGVVIFRSSRCDAELAALKPDVYVKGGDYTVESLNPAERSALLAAGTDIRFIRFVPNHSSSGTMRNERDQYLKVYKNIDADFKKQMLHISNSYNNINKYFVYLNTQKKQEDRLLQKIQSVLDKLQDQYIQVEENNSFQHKKQSDKKLLNSFYSAWNNFQNYRNEYDEDMDQFKHIKTDLKKVRLKRIQLALDKMAEKGV